MASISRKKYAGPAAGNGGDCVQLLFFIQPQCDPDGGQQFFGLLALLGVHLRRGEQNRLTP